MSGVDAGPKSNPRWARVLDQNAGAARPAVALRQFRKIVRIRRGSAVRLDGSDGAASRREPGPQPLPPADRGLQLIRRARSRAPGPAVCRRPDSAQAWQVRLGSDSASGDLVGIVGVRRGAPAADALPRVRQLFGGGRSSALASRRRGSAIRLRTIAARSLVATASLMSSPAVALVTVT